MADAISFQLPDGRILETDIGIRVDELVKRIEPHEYKAIIGAVLNEEIRDLREVLTEGGRLELLSTGDARALEILRHSASHLMAEAVIQLFPEAVLGIGPSTSEGFYYDFQLPRPFEPEDMARIEKIMQKLAKTNSVFERSEMTIEEAIQHFAQKGEVFKVELIRDLGQKGEKTVSIYRSGGFEDLCRGPHLRHTGQIRVFKLMSIAAAYWRGDERNPVLQRLYGTAFWTPEALTEHLDHLEQIKARDHRRLGRELDLYSIHEDVGAGLIFWHPRLAMVRHLVEEFWRSEHLKRGYGFVYTPHIAQESIYRTSGHLENYAENMYSPLLIDEKPYYLKPMNCPGHIKIYQTRRRSYRDLPIRYCELGTVYRYERSGTLHGMLRVRGFTQDDAHVFCTPEQIANEVFGIMDLVDTLMSAFGYTYKIFLATRPEKYLGTDEEWDVATRALREALQRWGKPYEVEEGGGVFYAPKIDVKLHDALGREWQGPTIQVDLNLPKRFNVTYIGPDNTEHEVIMIHRAVLGSMERFVGGLIEHVGGAFPLWLAPTQIVVMPITDKQHEYARSIRDRLAAEGFRVDMDERNEKIGYKIREAQEMKVPYMVVLGAKEADSGSMTVRHRRDGDLGSVAMDVFIARCRNEIMTRAMA
ncbi:threonine--tRNA ligase [bacterium]|nr:threonine--tRNA ligase [candidate division CSSED10-310 bacterium]